MVGRRTKSTFEIELDDLLRELDLWYTSLSEIPKSRCDAHRRQIETTIGILKRLYPQRHKQIDLAVKQKLSDVFSEGDENT